MSRTASLVIGLAGLLITSTSFLSAAELAVRAPFDTVAKVAAVTTRDGSGRVQRFTDTGTREFVVKYDAQQRVQSVEATRGPHISDIVSVGYAPDGKLVRVRFRIGYTVFFDARPNGTQVIRDSQGGALIRAGHATQPVDSAAAEQSAKLASAVTELESLMRALGQPTR
jgi:YD repeat-containing protein